MKEKIAGRIAFAGTVALCAGFCWSVDYAFGQWKSCNKSAVHETACWVPEGETEPYCVENFQQEGCYAAVDGELRLKTLERSFRKDGIEHMFRCTDLVHEDSCDAYENGNLVGKVSEDKVRDVKFL